MPVGGDRGFLPYKPVVELLLEAMAGPPPKSAFEGIRNPFIDRFLPKRKVEHLAEIWIFIHDVARQSSLNKKLPLWNAASSIAR